MIAKYGLFEFGKSDGIGNKSLAIGKIDGNRINSESLQIMKSQMRNGIDHAENSAKVFRKILRP